MFGYHCGMKFDTNGGVSNYATALNTFEAAASISDNAGNLLFYVGEENANNPESDFNVYGSNGNILLNGESILLNSSSTNGAVFVEIEYLTRYYLIHTGLNNDCLNNSYICYNLFMTEIFNNGTEWVVTSKNVKLSNKPINEKLAVTRHSNGIDWWLIAQTHKYNNQSGCTNEYNVFNVGADSIFSQTQTIGNVWCEQFSQFGEMVFSHSGKKLAIAIATSDSLGICSFDRCRGLLTDYRTVPLGANAYSVEFSPNEQILYVSYGPESGPQGLLQVYEKNSQDSVHKIWDYSERGSPGQLQIAPDGKIYFSSFFGNYYIDDTVNKYLTVINQPDSIGLACDLSILSYYVGDSCRTRGGLPNMPNYNLGPLLVYMADAGTDTFYCAGDSTIKAFRIGGDSIYGITYLWQPAPGIDTLSNRTQLVLPPPQSRWYYLTLTDTNYVGPSCNSRLDSVYIEVRNCTGITETTTLQAKLYPNPTTGTLTIELPNGQGGNMALYNLLGQSVYQTTLAGGQTTLALNLPPGLYLYRISSGGKAVNGKLLVE